MDAFKLLTRFVVCLLVGIGLTAGCGESPVASGSVIDFVMPIEALQWLIDTNSLRR